MAADLDLLYKLIVKDEGKRVLKAHQSALKKLTSEEKKAIKVSNQQKKAAQAQTKAINEQRKAREKQTKALKQNLGRAAATMAVVGVAALALGAKAVQMASNVEEAAQKFDEVFGPAAKRTGDAIDEFAEKAQRSKFALREMAADLGAILEPMLGSKAAASDMSVRLVKLTTDLSSFNNVAESDVLVAIRSGLIGNMEPMLQFGVVLRQSKVNAEVLASGMADTKDEITEAMRVTARFNIILRETSTASGDAERTGSSFANQMRGLEAGIEELVIGIGQELLPVVKDLVAGLLQLINLGKQTNDELVEMTRSEDGFTRALGAGAIILNKSNLLVAAFTENQRKMQMMVNRGELSLDEYNAAVGATAKAAFEGGADIAGMTDAVQLLDERSLSALNATRFLTETFGEEIINAGLVNNELLEMAAAHGDVAAAATLHALAQAEAELAMAATVPTAADLKAREDELKVSQEAAAETARRRAESLESMRKAAANAAIAHDALAESLTKATKVEFASAGIDLLKEKLNAGEIGAFEFEQATRNLMLANGLATEQSFAQADALEKVVGLYANNKISADELTIATALLKDAGIDGEIAMSDLGLSVADYTENADLAKRATQEYDESLGEWVQVSDDAIARGNLLGETYRAIEDDTRNNTLQTADFKDELKQVVGLFSELTSREWIITTRFDVSGEPPTPTTNAQQGFHGVVTGPHQFRIEPGVTERVDITPGGGNTTNNQTTTNTINQTINTSQPIDLGRQSNINQNRSRSF